MAKFELVPTSSDYPFSSGCLERREALRLHDPLKYEQLGAKLGATLAADSCRITHTPSKLSIKFTPGIPLMGRLEEGVLLVNANTEDNSFSGDTWELWQKDYPFYWGGLGIGTRLYVDGVNYLRNFLNKPIRVAPGVWKGRTFALRKRLHYFCPYTFAWSGCPTCLAYENASPGDLTQIWISRSAYSFHDHE